MLAQFPGYPRPQHQLLPCASQHVKIGRRCSSSSGTAVAVQRRSSNVVDYATGLGSWVQSNRISEAVSLLDTWLDERRRPHGLSTGDLLEALCKEGRHETAWRLIRRLSATNNRLSLKVLHRLLRLAGQHGTVDDVLAVYEHQQRLYGFASTGVQTTLIHALLKAGSKARPGNLLAYEAWGRLSSSGRQLDAQALLAGMHACVCVGRLAEAEALLEPLREEAGAVGRPVVSAFNLLMKAHASAANPDAARKVFANMKARGLTPDAVTYNTLLSSFIAAGEVIRARAVMDKMRREGVPPDAWTYTTLVLGLGQQGKVQEMQEVLQEMAAAGIQPNSATYAAVIDAYATSGDMAAAHAAMQQLCNQQQQQQQQPPWQEQQQVEQWLLQQQQELEQQWWQTEQEQQQQQQQQQQTVPVPPQLLLLQQQQQQQQQLHLPEVSATNGHDAPSAVGAATQVAEPPSRRVLRHLYNTLIKGHLRLAAAASGMPGGSSSSSSAVSTVALAAGSWDDDVGRMPYAPAAAAAGGSGSTSNKSSTSHVGSTSSTRASTAVHALQAPIQNATAAATARIPASQQQQQHASIQRQKEQYKAIATAAAAAAPAPARNVRGLHKPAAAAAAANRPLWTLQPTVAAPAGAAPNNVRFKHQSTAAAAAAEISTAVSPKVGRQSAAAATAATASISPRFGYQSALAVLNEMSAAGVSPGVDTYTLLVNHLVKANDPAGLQLLLEALAAAGLQPDQVLLTSLLKAAGQAGNHEAACEIFDMLVLATMPPAGSSIESSSSSWGATGGRSQQQQQLELLAGQLNGSSSSSSLSSSRGAGSSISTAGSATPASSSRNKQQQQRQQRQGQQQQQQQQQQLTRLQRGKQQQLLPLTASSGPDAVAWNALAAVLVQAGRLGDAAAAVERAVQAAAAVGQKTPPLEGFAALIRGYRSAGSKPQAVAALRRFLSLGGRPVRVMCNDVITLCLRDDDLRTARQVVRAMELTGCVSDADIASYHAWFERWQARSAAAAAASPGAPPSGTPGGSSSRGNLGSRGSPQADAVERLKWWLGLPNSYYDSSGSTVGSRDGQGRS